MNRGEKRNTASLPGVLIRWIPKNKREDVECPFVLEDGFGHVVMCLRWGEVEGFAMDLNRLVHDRTQDIMEEF